MLAQACERFGWTPDTVYGLSLSLLTVLLRQGYGEREYRGAGIAEVEFASKALEELGKL